MRLLITSFVILFGLMSPSFSNISDVKILEKRNFPKEVLISRICVGGYEFVLVCRNSKDRCDNPSQSRPNTYSFTQIITENGGGKKC